MAMKFVLYSEAESEAARAFNQRIEAGGGTTEFLLPPNPPPEPEPGSPLRAKYMLVLEDADVRGGFVMAEYPVELNGTEITAVDCIAPLSEGIVNPKYSLLAMQIVKYLRQHAPYAFAQGMGAADNPYPRLLRASGWKVIAAPFYYRIASARFFRELQLLRAHPVKRIGGEIAAVTGAGALAAAFLHRPAGDVRAAAKGLTIETPNEWGEWADEIWEEFRGRCSFVVKRDRRTLEAFHPANDARIRRYLLRRGGKPVAWAAALNTRMQGHKHFGNAKVATIMDCIGPETELAPAILTVTGALRREAADVVISNQTHAQMRTAFPRAGFKEGPTNFQVGLSKAVVDAVNSGSGEDRVYVTRADGDGRMHL